MPRPTQFVMLRIIEPKMFDLRVHGFNYTNPEAGYKVNISLDNLPKPQPDQKPDVVAAKPTDFVINKRPIQFQRATSGATEAASKVITASGGELSCYDCK